MTTNPLACLCINAMLASRATGREVECEHCHALVTAPPVAPPPLEIVRLVTTLETRAAPARALTYVAPPADERAVYRAPTVAAVRQPRAIAQTAEEREAARVRVLLYALRPDCADPLRPPPAPLTTTPTVRVRDPMLGWGDVPASLEHPVHVEDPTAAKAADVLARLREMPEDAAGVLRWLRAHAVFVTLRGLYVDVGLAFASAAQTECWARDLAARRDGSYHQGRTLVCHAGEAWGLPIA